MTGPTLPPLAGTATLDITDFRRGTRAAITALREVTDYARRNSTITLTARLSGANRTALRDAIKNAVGTAPLRVAISFDPASTRTAIDDLRAQLRSVVSINTSTLTAVQTAINTQITELRALIAELRALGGSRGGGGGSGGRSGLSAGTQALLADLQAVSNEYRRGDITAAQYATRLTALQATLRTAAGAATAGTAEFKALDLALTRTTEKLRGIETAKIVELRTQLQGARAAFDAAAGAARTLADRQAAISTYSAELNRARVALQGLASSGTLTAQQLGQVNSLLGQTARELNTIQGRVNLRGLSGNISNAISQFAGMVPGVGQLTAIMGELPVPVLAAAAAVGVLAAQLASAFRTAADFQQRMVDIKALTQPTAEQFGQLSDAALNSGVGLGVGAREAAAAILELNRAGLSAQDVIGTGLTSTLNLAAAAGIETGEAGRLAASGMTAFRLQSDQLPRIADNYANFANSTVLAATDLQLAIAAVGPSAYDSGLSIEEFAGLMVTAAKGGFRSMQDAGTSLKTALLFLKSPTDKAAEALDDLQLSVYDADGNLRPFLTVIDELRTKMSGLTEQERNSKLRDIFGSDALRIAQILYASTNEEIQRNIDLQGKTGEASRVANERLDSYNGAVKQLGASWEAFRISMGEGLLPALTQVVFLLNGTLELVKKNSDAIGKYGTTIQRALGFLNPLKPFQVAGQAIRGPFQQIEDEQKAFYERMEKQAKEYEGKNGRLGIAQANYIRGLVALQKAQEGVKTGINPLTGETLRTVNQSEVDTAQQNLVKLKQALTDVQSAAQNASNVKGGPGGVGASPEQVKKRTEALKQLRGALADRALEANLGGATDLDAAINKVKDAYAKLDAEASKAFRGNPNNSDLLKARKEIEAQQEKEIAAVRAEYRKKEAEKRKQEAEKAEREAESRAKTLAEAARGATSAEIAAMEEGRAKKDAIRRQELDDLRARIEERVALLKDDPEAQQKAQAYGSRELAAKQREQDRQRAQEVKDAQQQVVDAQKAARDAEIATLLDGAAKTRALREDEVKDFRDGLKARLDALKGYPALQRAVLDAARRETKALEKKWADEDARDARERALRIVEATRAAQDAAADARQAGRTNQDAGYELQLARRLALAKDNAVETARLEAQAIKDRARRADEEAAIDAARQRGALSDERDKALSATNLTAQERTLIWQRYYGQLGELDAKAQADNKKRLQKEEDDTRAAAERIRQARLAAATRPIDQTDRTLAQLDAQKQFAQSDRETLQINERITAGLEEQLARYRALLSGAAGVTLTAEEREGIEDKVQGILNRQKQAQLDQLAAARALTDAVQARAEAEAASAERNATTDQEVLAARLRLVGEYQKRLADLDGQIAKSGKAEERERLLTTRLGLTDQILEVEKKIASMPQEQQQRALDLLNARRTAALQLSGLADDAVSAAELELELTQRQQAATRDKLNGQRLSDADRSALLIQEAALSGQAATQQRKITEAQQARVRLSEALADSEAALTRQLGEQGTQVATMEAALNGVADARVKQARAERDYLQARQAYDRTASSGNAEKLRTATDALTSSVQGQRTAIKTLADEYGKLLNQMDGVQDSGKKLKDVLNQGKSEKETFNGNREIDRFYAIEKRRNGALDELIAAKQSGDLGRIQQATEQFTKQEQRYKEQAALLKKNGISINLSREQEAAAIADSIDLLGIQQDREAVLVEQRQMIVDQESRNVMTLGGAIDRFGEYGAALATRLRELQQGITPDRPTYYFDGQRFDSLAAVDAYDRARKAAPAVPATQPITNISNSWEVDVTVHAAPGQSPQQIADQVISTLQDRVRRSGRNC